ncbi:MAG: GNAT family protein [Candidatus Zixiibacteriota bacterium]
MNIDIVNDREYNLWEGERVRLRAMVGDDWKTILRFSPDCNGDRLVNFGIELPKTEEQIREFVEKYRDFRNSDTMKMFAIENKQGEYVGGINIQRVNHKNGTFSCGMRLFQPYRNNGFGEEAFRIALRYAFYEMRLQKCNSGCVDINEASIRLHKNIGFKEEGLRRRSIYFNGQFYGDMLFGITREEFEENDSRFLAEKDKEENES